MNEILEALYPDKAIFARRQATSLLSLSPRMDMFSAYLHEEMRQCYLNGHDHAALVTACALLDFAVKDAIHFNLFVEADCIFNPDEWDKIDALKFGEAANLAKTRGIVSKQEWKKLEWVREHIRNVYMHGQTPHWIKDKNDKIIEGNLETGEVREVTVSARENIVLQRNVRIVADRNVCDQVVRLVDWFVRTLNGRALRRLDEWKKANPSKPTYQQVDRILQSMREEGLNANLITTADYPDDMPSAVGTADCDDQPAEPADHRKGAL